MKLQVNGNKFTINGQPRFLLGISYFGALGAPKSFIEKDLLDMKNTDLIGSESEPLGLLLAKTYLL